MGWLLLLLFVSVLVIAYVCVTRYELVALVVCGLGLLICYALELCAGC